MNNWGNYIILNNTVRDWLIVIAIIFFSCLLLRLFKLIVLKKLKAFSLSTKTTIDDFLVTVIQRSVMPLLYTLTAYLSLKYINMSGKVAASLHIATLLVVTFFILRMVTSFVGYVFKRALSNKEKSEAREKQSKGILLIIQLTIWLIGILFLVDNLGYDITTLVAGLGIGGIAIALAAQTVLGDLFSYLVIFFDRPFEIGDFINIGDKAGTIEYIGIKTTRIRTLGGDQLICSNTDLTNSRVHNYKRMHERRVVFSFGVIYDTPAVKLKTIPGLIRKIIEPLDHIRFDRTHFQSFGDFSLNFEVVYYVLTSDYNLYMDKQQIINFQMFELFEKNRIEFAFPTQTLILNSANGKNIEELKEHSAHN